MSCCRETDRRTSLGSLCSFPVHATGAALRIIAPCVHLMEHTAGAILPAPPRKRWRAVYRSYISHTLASARCFFVSCPSASALQVMHASNGCLAARSPGTGTADASTGLFAGRPGLRPIPSCSSARRRVAAAVDGAIAGWGICRRPSRLTGKVSTRVPRSWPRIGRSRIRQSYAALWFPRATCEAAKNGDRRGSAWNDDYPDLWLAGCTACSVLRTHNIT